MREVLGKQVQGKARYVRGWVNYLGFLASGFWPGRDEEGEKSAEAQRKVWVWWGSCLIFDTVLAVTALPGVQHVLTRVCQWLRVTGRI